MVRGAARPGPHDTEYIFVPQRDGAEDGSITSEEARPFALKCAGVEIAIAVVSRAIRQVIAASVAVEQTSLC